MALRHPENLVTYGTRKLKKGAALADLARLEATLEQSATPAVVGPLRIRASATRLQALLEEADDDFDAQRYESALEGYGKVAQQVLRLMKPDLGRYRLPVEWPTGPDMERAIIEAAAGLISRMTPEQSELPAVLLDEDLAVDGVSEATLHPTVSYAGEQAAVDRTVERAGAAAEQGRWQEAASLYERALGNVTDPEQRADIMLNLGVMTVQLDRPEQALRHFQQAESLFTEIDDELGLAQVAHNSGMAHLRAGEGESAAASLKQARDLVNRANLIDVLEPVTGGGPGGPGGGGIGPVDPGGPGGGGIGPVHPGGPGGGQIGPVHPGRPGGGFHPLGSVVRPGLPGVGVRSRLSVVGLEGTSISLSPQVEAQRTMVGLGTTDLTMRLRPVRKGTSVPDVPLETSIQRRQETFERMVVLPVGGEVARLTWSKDKRLEPEELRDVWARRVDARVLDDLTIDLDTPTGVLSNLGHLYHLVLPIRMGDCHHELGSYERAEAEYQRAASYQLVNRSLEGGDLWRRLAVNTVVWGDSLYRDGNAQAAADVYERLTTSDGGTPNSFMYRMDSLRPTAERVIEWLEAVAASDDDEALPDLNPAIAEAMQQVRRRWAYLAAGLDFFGGLGSVVPPFTFRYLQEVARYFANRAVHAEQRYIEFYNRFEEGQMTRKQLESAAEQAATDVDAARQHEQAAAATAKAADASVNLSDVRHQNAQDQLAQFNDVAWELTALAGHIARGNAWHGGDQPNLDYSTGRYHFDDDRHVVLQELTRRQSQITNRLQRKQMEGAVAEANAARDVARQQREVAEARRRAATIERQAAQQRARHARDLRDAFEERKFTPELWERMAGLMRHLAKEALDRALETARLMQQAYNFEELDDRQVIRGSYDPGSTQGLLGGELLLSDIDSFTAYHVSQVRHKPIPVKWAVSLAEHYPGQFLAFAHTGRLEFELDNQRLSMAHPGTYGHQLKAVEVEVDGFLPPFGLHGRLTNSGIGRFRDDDGGESVRIQPAETMILSRYDRRHDAIILSPPQNMRALFEGNAVASGWTLEVPPSANDVDLHVVFDIRLVLYFECRYDPELFAQDTQPQDGEDFEHSRALHLRQHFPDAYFQLREHGKASIEVTADDFPRNQRDPMLKSVALAVQATGGGSFEGTTLHVAYPGQATPVQVSVGAQNAVPGDDLPVDGQLSALGSWAIELDEDHIDRKDRIDDLILVVDYQFTPAGA